MTTPRSKRIGTLQRTAIVTIRLDQKLRYLMELAIRKQRCSQPSFLERAIEEVLPQVLGDIQGALWDPDPAQRILKLAQHAPTLLTYDEEVWLKRHREAMS